MAKKVEDRIFCEVEDDLCDRREFVRGNRVWIHVEADDEDPLVARAGHLVTGAPVELDVVRADAAESWVNRSKPKVHPPRPKNPPLYKRPL